MTLPIKLTPGQNKAAWKFLLKHSIPLLIEKKRAEAAEKEGQALSNKDLLESEQNEE